MLLTRMGPGPITFATRGSASQQLYKLMLMAEGSRRSDAPRLRLHVKPPARQWRMNRADCNRLKGILYEGRARCTA